MYIIHVYAHTRISLVNGDATEALVRPLQGRARQRPQSYGNWSLNAV